MLHRVHQGHITRESPSLRSQEPTVKLDEEATLSREYLFHQTAQIRSQDNPYHRDNHANLMQNLNAKGINVDLATVHKVVGAIEILPNYFPRESLDCENPKHMKGLNLLLNIQEGVDTGALIELGYNKWEILDAENRLTNYAQRRKEELKEGIRESPMIMGAVGSIPIAGSFFEAILKDALRPGEQATVSISDIIKRRF